MAIVFKASLLGRGRQLILQSNSLKKQCISLHSYIGQVHKPLTQERLYSTDNESLSSKKMVRLYEGILHERIRYLKIFSLTTSATSIICQPILLKTAIDSGSKVGGGAILIVFGFFAFVTPLLLHLITKRYVAYVDYNPVKDTYVATTYSIFVRKQEVEFKPEDVKLPEISEMMTTCLVKGKPMFMDVKLFNDVSHYKRIMGFDKPINFRLHLEDTGLKKD